MRDASKQKRDRIALGLAVSALSLRHGQTRTLEELAAFCDCSWQTLWMTEQRALRKLRARIAEVRAQETL